MRGKQHQRLGLVFATVLLENQAEAKATTVCGFSPSLRMPEEFMPHRVCFGYATLLWACIRHTLNHGVESPHY